MSEKPTYEEFEKVRLKLEKTEKELRNTKEQLNTFFDNSPVAMALWDREFRYVYINEVLRKINGPSLEEHIGHTIEEVLPKSAHILRPLFEGILSSCKPVLNTEISGVIPSRPDIITHALASYFPVSIIDKTPEYIGGVIVDITERKLAEDALQESEKRLSSIYNMTGDIIFMLDVKGDGEYTFKTVNPAFLLATGLKAESVVGKNIKEVIPSASLGLVLSKYAQAIEEKATTRWEETSDYPTGKRTALVTIDPIFDDEGICQNLVGIAHDITARKTMERELIRSHKMEAIGTLAGGIAHDFNNVLSSIIGFTELALDDAKQGTAQKDNLQEVYSAGKRAKDLVWQILTFARETDEPTKPVQIAKIVNEALKFIRSSIPTSIEIRQNIDCDSLIIGNPAQTHQIIMNLCTNAAYAMERSGGVLEVTLEEVVIDKASIMHKKDLKPGDYVKLQVSDTGSGIPSDVFESIFEPYFSTKPPGEGTGMGLAVVKGIVEKSGGKITAENRLKGGATFSVYLPITRKHRVQKTYESEALPSGIERILFVDDEASIAKMGSRNLESLGYTVITRTSSVEALELFKSKPDEFDLVITDMTMPNMTGDKLAIELMKIRTDIPVILCTGYSKTISNDSAVDIGIKALAYKPIVKADLAETVRKVLDDTNSES